jgi:hypothetical protein
MADVFWKIQSIQVLDEERLRWIRDQRRPDMKKNNLGGHIGTDPMFTHTED